MRNDKGIVQAKCHMCQTFEKTMLIGATIYAIFRVD